MPDLYQTGDNYVCLECIEGYQSNSESQCVECSEGYKRISENPLECTQKFDKWIECIQ